ncbi:MAG: hypothetical protein HQ559_13695 [Lentisphaerae bacterium]|nr:hypothetical protein [Lentisphaerota bacterium]
MDYASWLHDVFGQTEGSDPVTLDLLPATDSLSPDDTLDYIDVAIDDARIHELYSKDQIGIGLQLIYCNSCSNMPFSYIEAGDEDRRVQGIRHLDQLYRNYFGRYCSGSVEDIEDSSHDGRIGYVCHMFWDIFVLYPRRATPDMTSAGLDVLEHAIHMANDNCIASAIHGLGHWAMHEAQAVRILQSWLQCPTTPNAKLIEYAEHARTGCIL